jgi:hypothetical protein
MPLGIPRILMRNSNIPPTAVDDVVSLSTYMGVPLNIPVLKNDFDVDNFPGIPLVVYRYDKKSIDGSDVIVVNSSTELKYTPKLNYFGIDAFTYRISDGLAESNTATVKLSVICKAPIISPKRFDLLPNKTYNLDITNPYSAPKEIVFSKDLSDRDENIPPQKVSIIKSSVKASDNIKINSITDTVINFTTGSPLNNTSILVGTWLIYDIINSTCNYTNNFKNSGSIQNPSVRLIQGWLGEVIMEERVPLVFTKYPMYSRVTKDYPWDNEGWFVFAVDAYWFIDELYISMVSKPYKTSDGRNYITDKYFKGKIGPIGLFDRTLKQGKCRFLFWHPINTNLDIWGASPVCGSAYEFGCVQVFRPSITDPTDPNRYFTDKNNPPTDIEILECLKTLDHPFNTTVLNVTNYFTGTSIPPFMSQIL